MAKALEAEGYAVTMEHDGERALGAIEEEPPDLVLLDLFLPGRDGFAVLEAVRELPGPARDTKVAAFEDGFVASVIAFPIGAALCVPLAFALALLLAPSDTSRRREC